MYRFASNVVKACLILGVLVGTLMLGLLISLAVPNIGPQKQCLPAELSVNPAQAEPGEEIVISAKPVRCNLNYSADQVYAMRIESTSQLSSTSVTHVVPVNEDGSFRFAVELAENFPPGEAIITVNGSAYDQCPAGASCVGYWVTLLVR